MEAPTVPSLPAVVAGDPTPAAPGRHQARVEQRAAVLYAVWATVASMAHYLGAVPLPAGGGSILGAGVTLTLTLFLVLGRLPVSEQPAGHMLVASQALLGICWSTLYAWFAAGSPGGAVIGVGMQLSAIALALPSASPGMLGRLMLIAALASITTPVVGPAVLLSADGLPTAAALVESLLPSLVLTVLLWAIYLGTRSLAIARDQLTARNADLQTGIERIARQSERDHLTNSYNRQSILEMVGREKARADRSGVVLCVCLLDIDHFKDMNDRFGHLAGDRILAAFAGRVRSALRTMDSVNSGGLPATLDAERLAASSRHAFGRVGGEEFLVLLPETSLRGALKCAERVRKAVVRRPFEGLHQVTVSIGIAEYRPGETVSCLLSRADEALYGAKNAGRNRVHCATTDGGPNAIVMPDIPAAS